MILLSGLIIGLVMGLTGAGGALVAIPLFMQWQGMSLKVASIYSLLAVVLAALLNFFTQRQHTRYQVALSIASFSLLGSLITAPFKNQLPEFVMKLLLASVAGFALWSVWQNKNSPLQSSEQQTSLWTSFLIGILLGALTTFTGLGGGVLMLPIFLKIYRMSQQQAVASSLLAVALASLISLLTQMVLGPGISISRETFVLLLGIVAAALLVKKSTQHLPVSLMQQTRRWVFSFVVMIALLKLL